MADQTAGARPVEQQDGGVETGSDNGNTDAHAAADKRIADLEEQLKQEKNKYLYLYADFDNYKKRAIKERSDAMKFGWEPAARELLQVVDNVERALTHMPATTDRTLVDGLHMVLNQFKATLEKYGVQRVPAVG